jgi:hypothetical protein
MLHKSGDNNNIKVAINLDKNSCHLSEGITDARDTLPPPPPPSTNKKLVLHQTPNSSPRKPSFFSNVKIEQQRAKKKEDRNAEDELLMEVSYIQSSTTQMHYGVVV